MTVWVVKGGRHGEREQRFLDKGLIGIGWEELGDLAAFATRESLKAAYRSIWPSSSDGNVATQVGQLWTFARSMQVGDLVVVPLKTNSQIAIGRVSGPYVFRTDLGPDLHHVRAVEWLRTDIPRSSVDKDLLYSFGSAQSVSSAWRNNAEARVAAMGNLAPSSPAGTPEPAATADVSEAEVVRDLEQDGRIEIIDFIRQRFKGHGLAVIVDGILRAQGFITRVSPPGADGGVDILAGAGPMGFDAPRLVVQVKSQESPADVAVLRTLKGTMSDYGADQGLLVCWGGFKSSVVSEAKTGYFRIRLWDLDDLLSALFAAYDRLDEDLRADLPLKRVWTVAREISD